jgi:hypothetical protein
MDVDKLKHLADTVERGVVEFPELERIVALDMSVDFVSIMSVNSVPDRSDIPNPFKVNACGCGIGFTILLFSPLKVQMTDRMYLRNADLFTEAALILDLTREQATALFLGRLSRYITGAEFARVIRNFLLTGNVNWMIITV